MSRATTWGSALRGTVQTTRLTLAETGPRAPRQSSEDASVRLPTVAAGSAGSLTAPVDSLQPQGPHQPAKGPGDLCREFGIGAQGVK